MAIRVTTSSNIQQWLRRFEKRTRTLKKDVASEPGKMARIGQELGRSLAPRDTGTLINAISWRVIEQGDTRGRGLVWVKPLINPKGGSIRTKGRASSYSAIHHSLPLGAYSRGQARSGDPHWLFTVKRELERRYGRAVLGHIQKFR